MCICVVVNEDSPMSRVVCIHVYIKGGPEPSKKIIQKVLFPIGQFHF